VTAIAGGASNQVNNRNSQERESRRTDK